MILRIEDIDSPRVKAEATQQAIDDLRWLGLDWDEGPDVGGPNQPYVQSERLELYRHAFNQLKDAEQIYPCTCSRSDVAAAASAPHLGQEGPLYPGTCSSRQSSDATKLGEQNCSWRFRTSHRRREFVDRFAGFRDCQMDAELGDFVIFKSDGSPAYQLAVVVDDHAMGITEVVRGDDLLLSTFRQLEIYDFFGWTPPDFTHVPLVVGADGRRLAKRHGDTRLSKLRHDGMTAEQLIGLLACSCGLRPKGTSTSAQELLSDFDLARIPSQPFVWPPD